MKQLKGRQEELLLLRRSASAWQAGGSWSCFCCDASQVTLHTLLKVLSRRKQHETLAACHAAAGSLGTFLVGIMMGWAVEKRGLLIWCPPLGVSGVRPCRERAASVRQLKAKLHATPFCIIECLTNEQKTALPAVLPSADMFCKATAGTDL
jgi:hypothetical protein